MSSTVFCRLIVSGFLLLTANQDAASPHLAKMARPMAREDFVGTWVGSGGGILYQYRLELTADNKGILGAAFLDEPMADAYTFDWDFRDGKVVSKGLLHACSGTESALGDGAQLEIGDGDLGQVKIVVRGKDWEEEALLLPEKTVEQMQKKVKKAMKSAHRAVRTD